MTVISPPPVDVHAHYLPRRYREALERAGIKHPDGFPFVPKWSPDLALALMDEVGIGYALLSISSPGFSFASGEQRTGLVWAVNEDGAAAVRSHPHRLGLLASLPLPNVDAALEEIEHASDVLHVAGFLLMTNYDGVYLGDERLEPVMEELARRDAVVALHPTSPPGVEAVALGRPSPMIEFIFDTTRVVTNLILSGALERHERLSVIVPHVGSALPSLADRVSAFARSMSTARSRGCTTTWPARRSRAAFPGCSRSRPPSTCCMGATPRSHPRSRSTTPPRRSVTPTCSTRTRSGPCSATTPGRCSDDWCSQRPEAFIARSSAGVCYGRSRAPARSSCRRRRRAPSCRLPAQTPLPGRR